MSRTSWVLGRALGLVVAASLASSVEAQIAKISDRKFPVGAFCPLESRASAGADLSFVAAGTAARIGFAVENIKGECQSNSAPCLTNGDCPGSTCVRFCSTSFTGCTTDVQCPAGERCGRWTRLRLDNVTVLPKATFEANLLSPSPFYEDCYFTSTPPGQTSGGVPNAPSYDHVAGGPEVLLERFDASSSVAAWTGDAYFAAGSSPRNPAGPAFEDLDETGGSLGIGEVADGHRVVSSSLVVTGLTPGQTYVVFGWWSVDFADRMTMTIEPNACVDADHDGFVVCNGCNRAANETCGECNDANPGCGSSCTDADQDGLCPPLDCDDTRASCTTDCTGDTDADGVPYCRDTCIDSDRDNYGLPGGGGATCAGTDCLEGNRYCNVSCVDGDADGACPPADCADANSAKYPNAPEINDCADQQCPGDIGYGVNDETSGKSGFNSGNKTQYSWPAQLNATSYQVVSSLTPDFASGCTFFATSSTVMTDTTTPAAGQVRFYLNRPTAPCTGSWGQRTGGSERTVCATPAENCTNGVDDDGDLLVDCNDGDCVAHASCQPAVFTFVDNDADDIATTAFRDFLQPLTTVGSGHYFFFEIQEPGWNRNVAWCATNAAFYRTLYLTYALNGGTVTSGTWNRWIRQPPSNTWSGPFTAGLLNELGDNSFGEGSWCSEQFTNGPKNCLFPDRTNDCEAYDLFTGTCGLGGPPWTVTIRIAPTRLGACGF